MSAIDLIRMLEESVVAYFQGLSWVWVGRRII